MIRQEYADQLRQTREQWQQTHGTEWGGSAVRNAGPELARWLTKHSEIKNVLDFGCGVGALRPYLMEQVTGSFGARPLNVYEYDPSVPGKDVFPDGHFDAIITVDVLEHVEPCSLDSTLEWIREHCDRQYHHIDCNETRDRLPDGRDVHLIIQEPEWWEQKLAPPARGWTIMERHVHDKRKRGRFPRRSCTFVLDRQG